MNCLFTIVVGFFLLELFLNNWNAVVQYLKESIWPLIRKQLPGLLRPIYRHILPKSNAVAQCGMAFLILVDANVASEVFKMLVSFSTLRFGAGIKQVVGVNAMGYARYYGSIAEGMHTKLLWNGAVEGFK
jgi:hypothetical protein